MRPVETPGSFSARPQSLPEAGASSSPRLVRELLTASFPEIQTQISELELENRSRGSTSLALSRLPLSARRNVEARLGPEFETWVNLTAETEPRVFWEQVQQTARRLQQRGELQAALAIHSFAASVGPSEMGEELHRRFEQNRDAILGTGPLTSFRADYLGRRFVRQALDPAMLGSFIAAGGVAHLVRTGMLVSLGSRTAPRLFTQGFGLEALAGVTAYSAEVPAFVAAHRGLGRLLGGPGAAGESATLGEELASAALFLGTLKIAGAASRYALGGSGIPAPARSLGQGAATLGGVYLGHRLEEGFGLRPASDEANRWAGAFETGLQLWLGGRVVGGVFGGGLSIPRQVPLQPGPIAASSESGLAEAASAGREGGPLGPPQPKEAAPESANMLRDRLGTRAVPEVVRLVHEIGIVLGQAGRFAEILAATRLQDVHQLEVGLFRLGHAVANADTRGVRGNYLNWITRLAVEEILRRGEPQRLDGLLETFYLGRDLPAYERQLAEYLPGPVRLKSLPQIGLFLFNNLRRTRRVSGLSLSLEQRQTIYRFLATAQSRESSAPLSFDTGNFFDRLEAGLHDASTAERIGRALDLAGRSPLGFYRIFRLHQLLSHEPGLYPKLQELAAGEARVVEYRYRLEGPRRNEAIAGTPWTGYFEDPRLVDLFSHWYRRLPDLIHPVMSRVRREKRDAALRRIWNRPRPLERGDVLGAFERLYDPLSDELLQSVRRGEVDLQILEPEMFEALVKERNQGSDVGRFWDAIYIPQWRWGPEWRRLGLGGEPRSTILLKQLRNLFSYEPFLEAVFYRLGHVVHEYEHHRHSRPDYTRDRLGALTQEMNSHLREYQWLAEHGELGFVQAIGDRASLGWALALRDIIETYYLYPEVGRGSETLQESPAAGSGPRDGIASLPPGVDQLRHSFEAQTQYTHQLLRFSLSRILVALREGQNEGLGDALMGGWMREVDAVLTLQNAQLTEFRNQLNLAERTGQLDELAGFQLFQEAASQYTRLRRAHQQVRVVWRSLLHPHSVRETDLRRRLDWLLALPEFAALHSQFPLSNYGAPAFSESRREEEGRALLRQFYLDLSPSDLELFDRAANGPIRDRDIAFDLDKTLGDTYLRYLAEDALGRSPEKYDGFALEDLVHQYSRVRLPYRGIQAMLLGLWAAGNRLRLYTASENLPENHEIFFNDFPLLKVAFGFNPPQDPHRLLTPGALHQHSHFMDGIKRRGLHQRYFGSAEGQAFLASLQEDIGIRHLPYLETSKIPLPEFPMDVLVDDLWYYAGELQTLGFGRRWISAPGTGEGTLRALEDYFSRPLPEISDLWQRWFADSPSFVRRG